MAKGGFPGARRGRSGGNNSLIQQAQMQQKILKMQREIEAKQDEVESMLFTATVGGGAVKAICSGKKELSELIISPDALDPNDIEALQDMIVSAVNDALRQADETMDKSLANFSGGLKIGSLGL